MLHIKDIRKKYVTGDLVQTALDGVSLTLRDHEFVAILGPSGSGKTTLLNVIGGLDRYDSGDLVINGVSTQRYSSRDWDSYRNHTIGFVFQSYNLIPHQNVLANVELALTISGISRSERKRRAKQALENVGLGDQLHKRPNQMSGGQMQRVAIARALVNNPDILLADEPTGALDSETSIQVMELLKEVARDRLVVMVTHNPELAEAYASRIVRVRDGRIIDDSDPYQVDTQMMAPPKHKNMGRSRMSYGTALSLSFNNLRTKIARTLLTSFAGSIGIIGIALILSLSTGFQKYIDKIQTDTLANYPLTIQSETADMAGAFMSIGASIIKPPDTAPGTVVEQQMLTEMFAQVGANDLGSFKAYMETNYGEIGDAIQAIKYSYSVKPVIYAWDTSEKVTQVNPGNLFTKMTGNNPFSSYMDTDVFKALMDNTTLLDAQYEVVQGRWPKEINEMILVLNSPNQISDYTAYTIGLKNMDTLDEMLNLIMSGLAPGPVGEPMEWSYEDLMQLRFRLVPASAKYRYNQEYAVWEDMSEDAEFMRALVDSGQELQIVGIVCPREGASAALLTEGVYYTSKLTEKIIRDAADAEIVKNQLADRTVDVFTGKPFGAEDSDTKLNFEDMISVDADLLSSAFGFNVSESAMVQMLEGYISEIAHLIEGDRIKAQTAFTEVFSQLTRQMLTQYIEQHGDADTGMAVVRLEDVQTIVEAYMTGEEARALFAPLAGRYSVSETSLQRIYQPLLILTVTGHIASQEQTPDDPENETENPVISWLPPELDIPSLDDLPENPGELSAAIGTEDVETIVERYTASSAVSGTAAVMSVVMTQDLVQQRFQSQLSKLGDRLMQYIGSAMEIDEGIIASAFQFKMDQDELMRLIQTLTGARKERTVEINLQTLGYAQLENPSAIAVYLKDFAGKERFMDFLDSYNLKMENSGKTEQVIRYTDVTGVMMSSVRTIVDAVSYVLIAFVAVSLVVSSIMIGIITYISVMERTKEIGVLRAIGASKRNISQVFNAETFIIGLCSGALGIGITLALNIPINYLIHYLTGIPDINAQLPPTGAVILVVLSVLLTLIGGFIPSKKAARKDPVIALRSE